MAAWIRMHVKHLGYVLAKEELISSPNTSVYLA